MAPRQRSCALLEALVLLVIGALAAQAAPRPLKPAAFPDANCAKPSTSTVFRVNSTISKEIIATTYCFGVSTGPANAPKSKCGVATTIDKWELWAPYASRYEVTQVNIRDNTGRNVRRTGSWYQANSVMTDKLVVSKLNWTAEYVDTVHPRICLTLSSKTTLDGLCSGPQGSCSIALYSFGSKGAKCCPIYSVTIPQEYQR